MTTLFSIILPTHDHDQTISSSIQSILNQTVQDFEVHVIGDGVSEKLATILKHWEQKDSRIHFHGFAKGPRHGECYRHEVLREIKSRYIAYLSDDDLWLPQHLEKLLPLLAQGNFVHSLPVTLSTNGELSVFCGDLNIPEYRAWLVHENRNFIPLHCVAHTLKLYRELPYGWRTTPSGIPTDLYMWQQFLQRRSCIPVSGWIPTTIHLPASVRKHFTQKEKTSEFLLCEKKLAQPGFQEELSTLALKYLSHDRAEKEMKLELFRKSVIGKVFRFFHF